MSNKFFAMCAMAVCAGILADSGHFLIALSFVFITTAYAVAICNEYLDKEDS